MPLMNGKEFMKRLREKKKDIPVIALTSNSTLDDKVEMFELGVDDYLTKPFELKELELRIRSLTKRKDLKIEDIIVINDLEINLAKHKVYKENKEIELSNKEYLIIEFLSKNR
jgi:DNA-binding response OmpR family regulator